MLGGPGELDRANAPEDRSGEIEALYQTELPKLVRYLRRKTGRAEEAAELAHDSFLKFIRAAPTLVLRTPEAYLRRIATNLLRDRADKVATRHEAFAVPIEEAWSATTGIDPHRELEAREELARVERVLANLPPLTRRIFWLHRVEGLSYREIQEQLLLTEGVVKAHMRKAIARTLRHRGAR